jgi:uncharacterized Zn finger protein
MPNWRDGEYDYFKPSQRIRTEKGLKARSQRGKIGQSWWARAWIAALERFTDPGRLSRGRSYARSGQVLSLTEKGDSVHAQVQGSRPTPYRVRITLKQFTREQWDKVIEAMAGEAAFAAQLLAGEMPQDIDTVFADAGVSLFPASAKDMTADCSCPDSANPCKHIAATHYILGEQLDDDPFMLFRLRGRTEQEIFDALHRRRRSALGVAEDGPAYDLREPEVQLTPLADQIEAFWQTSAPLDGLVTAPVPPAIPMPLLRRLGNPGFLPDDDLAQILAGVYDAIGRAALEAAER